MVDAYGAGRLALEAARAGTGSGRTGASSALSMSLTVGGLTVRMAVRQAEIAGGAAAMSNLSLISSLLVLVVVLFLGFAGCDTLWGLDPVTPPGPLEFSLQVVYPLAVVGDVTFTYLRPGDTTAVTKTATQQGDLYVFSFDEREVGAWMVNCAMTANVDGVPEHKASLTGHFIMPDSGNWVYRFVASLTPPDGFVIQPVGLDAR
ncbi:hypothetical protein ABZV93_22345 [Actinopolymorpha sp. NPDC004070]|uniref:hypothetical protein n=1 Tax=Actinopolymorpha sp. NPDC004070 TaxID=3154548 RepID=UPI0033AD8652